LRTYGGDAFELHSAGLEPKGIHPLTIQGMNEIGFVLEGRYSKGVKHYLG
jgi:arsenate reductase